MRKCIFSEGLRQNLIFLSLRTSKMRFAEVIDFTIFSLYAETIMGSLSEMNVTEMNVTERKAVLDG